MANTYYDSQLTAAEIEAALEAIDGVIVPANNGKVLAINNGKLEARSVQWGGGSTLEPLSVTENGDYYPEAGVDGFEEVHVSVPNSYTASDEGKVVNNGALVAQTARTTQITENGTYDTTLNDEVTVDVSGGGSAVIQSLSVSQNGTYTAPSGVDGYSPVVVNVSGGSSEPLLYRLNGFFGDAINYVNSLTVTLNGTVGETAVLIVEHRTDINVTGGLTLIDKSRGSDFEQYISVYSKILTSATENIVITTTDSSNKIIAAATMYFNHPVSIGSPTQQHMDSSSGNYKYTITPSQHIRLAVINNAWAAANSSHTINKMRYVLPESFIGNGTITIRLAVFIIYDLNENVVFEIGISADATAYANNRLFLYDIV